MVLPLIPVALIAVGAATGGSGLALGGRGILDIKKSQDEINAAKARYEKRYKRSETLVDLTNRRLTDWGNEQQQALGAVVVRMVEFMRRNEKKIREHERLLVDGLEAEIQRVPDFARLDVDAGAWLGGVLRSATVATGTKFGVTAVASNLGTASTGAAIAGLSGAAADSALMAFLGGGSLAAGGGGVALGTAALNVVTLGPALLIGGFVAKGQGTKSRTRAAEKKAEIEEGIATLGVFDSGLHAIKNRVAELSDLLDDLQERAITALDVLESDPFDPNAHAERFQRAMALTVAVRDVASAPIVNDNGDLTEESAGLSVKYRAMTAEGADA